MPYTMYPVGIEWEFSVYFKHSLEQYRCGQFGHFTCNCCIGFTGQQSGYGKVIGGFCPVSRLTFSSAVSSGLWVKISILIQMTTLDALVRCAVLTSYSIRRPDIYTPHSTRIDSTPMVHPVELYLPPWNRAWRIMHVPSKQQVRPRFEGGFQFIFCVCQLTFNGIARISYPDIIEYARRNLETPVKR